MNREDGIFKASCGGGNEIAYSWCKPDDIDVNEPKGVIQICHGMADHFSRYLQMAEYLTGQCDFSTAVENIKKSTRHFAKRQITWYKKMPYIHWFTVDRNLDYEKIVTDMADTLVKSGKRM